MKIALEVKNSPKIIKPTKDNVILYDGKVWYVTTKKELFAEYEALMDEKIKQINALIEKLEEDNSKLKDDNSKFEEGVSEDILAINNIVKELYKGE